MKKLFFILVVIAVIWFILNLTKKQAKNTQQIQPIAEQSPTPTVSVKTPVSTTKKSLFVPYWNISEIDSSYDRAIYFGITADSNGIVTNEVGYKGIDSFLEKTNATESHYLTLRLLDTNENLKILADKKIQEKIISQTLQLAQEKGFDGVVLDLELSVIPFQDVEKDITAFVNLFGSQTKSAQLKSSATIYGDVFYRLRPFNMTSIGQSVDEVMIMAYDFSKSYGEPGPNFPLEGKETYGYDFKTMIYEYQRVVPTEKLTVIFGMFGYDWMLGQQGKPLKRATALTLAEIEEELDGAKVDTLSQENIITYTDKENYKHIVWYENQTSVQKKEAFMNSQGIGSISFWVNGYFSFK